MGGDRLWEAISAIGEVAGAIAVVATLIFLLREMRVNTKAIIGSAMRATSLSFADFNTRIASDPDLARIVMKSFESEMAEWTGADWFRFNFFARSECDRMGDLYRQWQLGNFSAEEADLAPRPVQRPFGVSGMESLLAGGDQWTQADTRP